MRMHLQSPLRSRTHGATAAGPRVWVSAGDEAHAPSESMLRLTSVATHRKRKVRARGGMASPPVQGGSSSLSGNA